LGCGLGWAKGIIVLDGVQIPMGRVDFKGEGAAVEKDSDILP